jgi:hypothetical protein
MGGIDGVFGRVSILGHTLNSITLRRLARLHEGAQTELRGRGLLAPTLYTGTFAILGWLSSEVVWCRR